MADYRNHLGSGIEISIIEPDSTSKYGIVSFEVLKGYGRLEDEGSLIIIDPSCYDEAVNCAIALRIAARFLDNSAKGKKVKPWLDPRRSPEDRAAWRKSEPESLNTKSPIWNWWGD